MDIYLTHRDTADEAPEQPEPAPQPRPWRPQDVYDCERRTGHRFIRDLDSRLRCLTCNTRRHA